MRLRLTARHDELLHKGDQLVAELSQALATAHPELAERLHKALPDPEPDLQHQVLRDLQQKFAAAYARQMEAMRKDIGRVLDQAGREVAKSLDSEEDA